MSTHFQLGKIMGGKERFIGFDRANLVLLSFTLDTLLSSRISLGDWKASDASVAAHLNNGPQNSGD